MVKATYNGITLAESTDTIVVEGNHYFPPDSINKEYFGDSETQYALIPPAFLPYLTILQQYDMSVERVRRILMLPSVQRKVY